MSDLQTEAAKARRECNERRQRVLAQPDIARLLTEKPLGYKQPQQWTGYIPPAIYDGSHNHSPRRAALLTIMQLVDAREADIAAGRVEPTPTQVDEHDEAQPAARSKKPRRQRAKTAKPAATKPGQHKTRVEADRHRVVCLACTWFWHRADAYADELRKTGYAHERASNQETP